MFIVNEHLLVAVVVWAVMLGAFGLAGFWFHTANRAPVPAVISFAAAFGALASAALVLLTAVRV